MEKKNKILFSIIIFSFLISAASVFILPISNGLDEDAEKIASMVLGVLFWVGTILGYIFKFILVKINKKQGNTILKEKWGLFKLFKNKPGKFNDSLLILSLIVMIASAFIDISTWIIIICLFLFILSLELHFVFNGKCYKYFKSVE